MSSLIVGALVLLATLLPATGFAANCCSLNGGACTAPATITHGTSPWTGAVCGSVITGTNCTAILDANVSVASGDCITLGRGVTLDLNGYALNCTSGQCGGAILNTDSAANPNDVDIENGDITGCWTVGIAQTQYQGSDTNVSDIFIDLDGSCTGVGGSTGIAFIAGKIDRTIVKNARSIGIFLLEGEDVTNTKVSGTDNGSGSGTGIVVTGSGTSFDNVLLTDNVINVHFNGGQPASMQRSELQNASVCQCRLSNSTCPAISSCFTISNSTTPSFIGDAIIP